MICFFILQQTLVSLSKKQPAFHLVSALFHSDPYLDTILQQLIDALEGQMEDFFFQTLSEVAYLNKTEKTLPALILWAWNQMSWQDFDERPLFEISFKAL